MNLFIMLGWKEAEAVFSFIDNKLSEKLFQMFLLTYGWMRVEVKHAVDTRGSWR